MGYLDGGFEDGGFKNRVEHRACNPLDQRVVFGMRSPGGDELRMEISGYINPLNMLAFIAGMAMPERLLSLGAELNAPPELVAGIAMGHIDADQVFTATTGKTIAQVRAEAAEQYPVVVPDTIEGLDN